MNPAVISVTPAILSPACAVFAVTTLLVAYILIGYPLLLAISSARPAPPIRKDPAFRPTVSILLAVHNGEAFIAKKLDCLLGLHYPTARLQILVVSDGSTDHTDRIVESYAARGVRLLRLPRSGKATALNAALPYATGDILFFTDVRQAIDPDALSHLAANFADPTVGAATGELRILDPGRHGEQADMELYWRYELWARRHHSRIDSIFSVTGCIYALRRSLAEPLPPGTLTDDAVFSLRAFFRGYRVVFDPEALAYDYPTAEGAEFRRKLRTLAGLWQLHVRLPALFTRANRMRFHFLSYKFARLLLPWAVLLVWISTFALPAGAFRDALIVDELMFIAVAMLDFVVPKGWPLKRISSPAKSFLAMNAAAALAPIVFFVPVESLWKKPTQVAAPPAPRPRVVRREP
ncbi:MAG TPA: glycosyltransferase family 2 protein [Bryobacteraceae bacterium]|nr:glycosyltransferase family 2 protein [Bryobacteraceae bacterium]